MILFINACVWDESRTKRLADHLLSMMDEPVTEIRLIDEEFPTVDIQFLDKRERLKESGDYSDPMFRWGKQFASADTIVIAAPYWDLSFPAALKTYFEQKTTAGSRIIQLMVFQGDCVKQKNCITSQHQAEISLRMSLDMGM